MAARQTRTSGTTSTPTDRHPLRRQGVRPAARVAQQRDDLDQPDLGGVDLVLRASSGTRWLITSGSSSPTSVVPAGPCRPDGPVPYDLLADDIAALDRRARARSSLHRRIRRRRGFGDDRRDSPPVVDTGDREPRRLRPVQPPTPTRRASTMARQMLGGRADATRSRSRRGRGPRAASATMVDLMRADHDVAQGDGTLEDGAPPHFDRVSQPPGYTVDDIKASPCRP